MAEQNKSDKYAYLDQLSTERLEELIRADIEAPEHTNDEAIFRILEVVKKREQEHPTGRLVDVDEAWAEFQQYYNIPEGEGLSLYPTESEEEPEAQARTQSPKVIRLRSALKVAGIAAAVVIGIFGTMVFAQAAGFDVFGAIGRWTEETFHFVIFPTEQAQSGNDRMLAPEQATYYNALQSALVECGLSDDLAPTWYPEGFEAAEPEVFSDEFSDTINCVFTNAENDFFSINITHYNSSADIASRTFEKDEQSVETYTSGDSTFYILSNLENTIATWSDGTSVVMKLTGGIPVDEIKAMVDSMGGRMK